jgi:hypothetical protein
MANVLYDALELVGESVVFVGVAALPGASVIVGGAA